MPRSTSILLLGGAKPETSRLRRALARHFLLVDSARNIAEARQLARRCHFDALVLVDPDRSWRRIRAELGKSDELPRDILVIAERSRARTAIEALRDGVSDVLLRPVSNDELVGVLTRVLDNRAGPAPPQSNERLPPAKETTATGYPLDWTLERVKRHHMARVLGASGGNKTIAARRLEISRKTLERKLGTRKRD